MIMYEIVSYLIERDRLSNKCKIELTFFSLSVFNAKRVNSSYCRLFTHWADDRACVVSSSHNLNAIERWVLLTIVCSFAKLMIELVVNSLYCLNAIDRWIFLTVVDFRDSYRDRVDAIMSASSRTKKLKSLKTQQFTICQIELLCQSNCNIIVTSNIR